MSCRDITGARAGPADQPGGWSAETDPWGGLALLRRGRGRSRRGRLLREVVVEGHAAADVGVEVPLHRPRSERLLRLHNLLEHRVVRRLLVDDLVVDVELLLEDRDRR